MTNTTRRRPARSPQGGTCPRCGSKRSNDGFCSVCFTRALPR